MDGWIYNNIIDLCIEQVNSLLDSKREFWQMAFVPKTTMYWLALNLALVGNSVRHIGSLSILCIQ